jgi:hypothetical protein
MALRLSSFLLIGVSRIFSQKVHILLQDCNEAYTKLTLAFKPSDVDMAPVNKSALTNAITDKNLAGDSISGCVFARSCMRMSFAVGCTSFWVRLLARFCMPEHTSTSAIV